MKKLIYQIVKFGGVGVLCFIIDFAALRFFHEVVMLDVLVSTALAFTISVIANYILSVRFVFAVSQGNSKTRNFILFVIFSVIGLGLTELLMHLGVNTLSLNYVPVKVGATAVVMVFNFITRKIFLEK